MIAHSISDVEHILAGFVPPILDMKKKYSLDTMKKLMETVGNPHKNLKIIHVAGTSGKTSTSYYLASLLMAKGLKTGLTVSPHIVDIRERAQINLTSLEEHVFVAYFNEFLAILEDSGLQPSYFEVVIAFAYWVFDKEKVDYAVIETGLGGLLDGTNVADNVNKICVITDIGYDHTDVLGTHITDIALQKAGIMHPGNHAYLKEQTEEVVQQIATYATFKNAQLKVINATNKPALSPSLVLLYDQLPDYQQHNWTLAKSVLENEGIVFTEEQLVESIGTSIPARMETFVIQDKLVILDGAHNSQKMAALLQSIDHKYPGKPFSALVALAENKSERLATALNELAKRASNITITEFELSQDYKRKAIPAEEVEASLKLAGAGNTSIIKNPFEALQALLESSEPIILVTGSFYLASIIRGEILKKIF